ncbi:hypothetical protein Sgly_1042 [Syntrophobotulus glycolicus DSM 8271]|uniref:Uncharacterized protein n=1 Tax=Syntrophobotulus glycolicus (strain DSM 8271 / FlGlyR) TaxID=645991 RepID=F0STT3_SYNGF|nr:hypothetical protein [Syntrophobotulus glycolicus]ADY55373.1 hypothetical protein Sgly_1042 [Syntrophobotulus glycolicus DSM 8271]
MKSKKYKVIALTLIVLCLYAIPVYAYSYKGVSAFTNLSSYVGGYSYTSGSGTQSVSAHSQLWCDGELMDSDEDYGPDWAQADVGHNANRSQTHYWSILGTHRANGAYGYKTSSAYYTFYY